MNTDSNIELRKVILEYALSVEHLTNSLILSYLGIQNQSTKAFGNKSGSLSFKNKIDLLYDIEVLSKEEHLDLELLMIFRNQFLHNLNCNSFTVAISLFDKGIEKRLLRFRNLAAVGSQEESSYSDAYANLYFRCLQIIKDKITKRKKIISDKSKVLTDGMKHSIFFIDTLFRFFDELLEKCTPSLNESKQMLEFKMDIANFTSDKSKSISHSRKYKRIKANLDKISKGDSLKNFIK